jgi:hypothetical protein
VVGNGEIGIADGVGEVVELGEAVAVGVGVASTAPAGVAEKTKIEEIIKALRRFRCQ